MTSFARNHQIFRLLEIFTFAEVEVIKMGLDFAFSLEFWPNIFGKIKQVVISRLNQDQHSMMQAGSQKNF